MPLKLDDQPNLHPLGSKVNYLQVLLPEFTLRKQEKGVLLEVAVTDDLYAIRDSAGKRDFFTALLEQGGAAHRQAISDRLAQFERDPNTLACRFDCADCPFRYGNGGVLPVIRLDGTDYFCLFYRDVFPVGWNIANGGSDNMEEMLEPERILNREFAEELLVIDDERRLVYGFGLDGSVSSDTRSQALDAWTSPATGRPLREYTHVPLPVRWFAGPDQVCVTAQGKRQTTSGYFLSITPEDNGIEVDRIALIDLNKNIRLLDGEMIRKNLLGRIIGLFPVADLMTQRRDADYLPKHVFIDGERWSSPSFASLTEEINRRREKARARGVLGERAWADYESARQRFTLCPVTRNIVKRYYEGVPGLANEGQSS